MKLRSYFLIFTTLFSVVSFAEQTLRIGSKMSYNGRVRYNGQTSNVVTTETVKSFSADGSQIFIEVSSPGKSDYYVSVRKGQVEFKQSLTKRCKTSEGTAVLETLQTGAGAILTCHVKIDNRSYWFSHEVPFALVKQERIDSNQVDFYEKTLLNFQW